MALVQADMTAAALRAVYPELAQPGLIKYVVITTSGDMTQQKGDIPLAAFGSKELWTKEVEVALQTGRIDIGVHCVKDVPSFVDPSFAFPAVLKRDDPRDAWLCLEGFTLENLPAGSVVGTSSARRQGIILSKRPDLKVVPIRGNADTRIEKLRAGVVRATLLSRCGLERIDMTSAICADLSVDEMLPACGQGAICLETLAASTDLNEMLRRVNHLQSEQEILAERALLQTLDGTCTTPISAYARSDGAMLTLRGLVVRPDGTGLTTATRTGAVADAEKIGNDLAQELKQNGPADIFDQIADHAAGAVRG